MFQLVGKEAKSLCSGTPVLGWLDVAWPPKDGLLKLQPHASQRDQEGLFRGCRLGPASAALLSQFEKQNPGVRPSRVTAGAGRLQSDC